MPRKPAEADKPHYLGHRQRLREWFLEAPDALPDYEFLELVLCLSIQRIDVKPLAKKLIDTFGSYADVLAAEPSRLAESDLNEKTIVALKTVQTAAVRMARPTARKRRTMSSWSAVIEYLTAEMAFSATEEFRVLYLDRKNGLIANERHQKGTVDHTPVYPREVVKRALELSASALIMVHNHPSGDPEPSAGDIDMTSQVQEACQRLGITLHDHAVIGRGKHVSFRARWLL
ncbi:MAG: DNA repair protein RadC [Alphaproteobacteria bacterium]|nr:DNA repair protein RadC [Alphaproteobacteria bacterium]